MSYANDLRYEVKHIVAELRNELGEMTDRIRAMEAKVDNFVDPPKPEVRHVNAYTPGCDWARKEPKVALTDLELRVLLRECGVGLRDDALERAAQGKDAQFKPLPTSQRFLRRFREGFQRFAPDAAPGSADALLTRLGYRGDFHAAEDPADAA